MRVDVSANGRHLSPTLRAYAEGRAWRAVHRWARQVTWVGVQLSWHQDRYCNPCVRCQIDVLLRGGGGMVTVRHTDGIPYVGIDCAAVRLSQALKRRLGPAGHRALASRPLEAARASATAPAPVPAPAPTADTPSPSATPRLAVVVRPTGQRAHFSLPRWLRTRYGIEQVQNLVLSSTSWTYLTGADPVPSEHLDWLRQRLMLAELCKPELIVVLGHSDPAMSRPSAEDGRQGVERLVRRIVAMSVSSEIIGVSMDDERWDGDPSVARPRRVDARQTRVAPAIAEVAILSGDFDAWLAERHWEDDGGSLQNSNPQRRQQHVERTTKIRAPGMGAPTRPWASKSQRDLSGPRPDRARLAARH